ncbi:MAG: FHA domain-containing protein [Candidatus Sumerlaeaceae bacterium]
MPELVLKLGDNVLQTYVFDKDVMSIGRSRDNDVVVENLSVSRNHARVRRQNGKYILTDLNSANGTYVNGVRVSKTEIVNDDVISIGKHKLHFADQVVDEDKMIADAFGADRTVVVERVPVPVLCVSDGKLKGQEFQVTKFETSIGKSPSNDIVINDDWFLAKKQAVIIRRGNSDYEIHCMGGFKRTKVNGVQITEPKVLQAGDVLEFGNTRCIYQYSGEMAIPSGRVPQEMALEDSIFSSGISYSDESAPLEKGVETPFMAQSEEDSKLYESFEAEPVFDTGEMAREAIAADEVARAEARQSAQPVYSEAAAYGNGNHEPTARVSPEPESLDSLEDLEDVLSLDSDFPSSQSTFAEAQVLEAAEEPAPVYAGVEHEEAEANVDQPVSEVFHAAQPPPVVPLTPAAPAHETPVEAMVSVSGGRSNRKKKRDRDRQPAEPESGSISAGEPQRPNFDERVGESGNVSSPESDIKPADSVARAATGNQESEIALWEAALTNRSEVIRRQAAKMLKKLTGKDYEV